MDFFFMRMDPRVTGAAKLAAGSPNLRAYTREQIQEISKTMILYVGENQDNQYPDIMEETGILVSEKLKRIMSKYQRDAIFKTVVLMDKKTNRQAIYYLMSPPQIECASDKTVYDRRGHIEEFVLDEEKVGHARIFCAQNYRDRVFVRLDVAESILRRVPYGVSFEKAATGTV
jgi:hypothetical protein